MEKPAPNKDHILPLSSQRWHDEICIITGGETSSSEVQRTQNKKKKKTLLTHSPPTHTHIHTHLHMHTNAQIGRALLEGTKHFLASLSKTEVWRLPTSQICCNTLVLLLLPAGFHHAQCVTRQQCYGD